MAKDPITEYYGQIVQDKIDVQRGFLIFISLFGSTYFLLCIRDFVVLHFQGNYLAIIIFVFYFFIWVINKVLIFSFKKRYE